MNLTMWGLNVTELISFEELHEQYEMEQSETGFGNT